MRVLVTGANGFIGSSLCRKLIDNGNEVTGLVRKTSDLSLIEELPIRLVVGSLGDITSIETAVKGTQLVYHLAAATTDWGTKEFFHKVNVEGTRNLLEASVKEEVKRFVYSSSVVVHSFIDSQDMTEKSPQLPTPFHYCQTKRDAEALVMEYHRNGKITATIVRPGIVFGPGSRDFLKMAKALEEGKMIYVGSGDTFCPFSYVENLVDGLILAGMKEEAAGETYVITDGVKLTWRDYLEKVSAELGVPAPSISVNPKVLYAAAWFLENVYRLLGIKSRPVITRQFISGLRGDFHFSIDKARQELGYKPNIIIDEGVRRTVDWYKMMMQKYEE